MNNSEKNYKKYLDNIHASEELKEKTFKIIKENKSRKNRVFIPVLSFSLALVMCFGIFFNYQTNLKEEKKLVASNVKVESKKIKELPRFKNMEELKGKLEKRSYYYSSGFKVSDIKSNAFWETAQDTTGSSMDSVVEAVEESAVSDFSTTNLQVENVDEADIVKTDGNYIYYVSYNTIYIVNAKNLEKTSEIKYDNNSEKRFSPKEVFLSDDKLIVLGTETQNMEERYNDEEEEYIYNVSKTFTKAKVYDISNKEKIECIREVAIEGNYRNSRLIGKDIYFISEKYAYVYENLDDNQILPTMKDQETVKLIDCTDIAYFEESMSSSYTLVCGFNIENDDEANVETFLGGADNIYASEKNLYIINTVYKQHEEVIDVYKFSLDNSKISLKSKAEVPGNINNQFSIDEYEGNLRIATTVEILKDEELITTNEIFILDEDLKQIGKIDNLAEDEKIYAVRFIGKIGYVVTFKQIDPLFVIDLSDPYNPDVKGALKIPGYSSYLHPYDETHIIGIGYNTKSNGYGGERNANMKMSMFDVSDLEHPTEMFSIDIGDEDENVSSEITSNHKALFYNKNKNLIGFAIKKYGKENNSGIVVYEIDLKEGFKEHGMILEKNKNYFYNVERMIYIEDTLYTLFSNKIKSYDLDSMEYLDELVF